MKTLFERLANRWHSFGYEISAITLGGVVYSMPFLLAGLGFILFLGEHSNLQCQRVEPSLIDCKLVSSKLSGIKVTPLNVNTLQGAEVEVKDTIETDGTTFSSYRVMLLTRHGSMPMTTLTIGGREQYKIAEKITSFLGDRQQSSLKVEQDTRLGVYLLAAFFLMTGGWVMLKCGY